MRPAPVGREQDCGACAHRARRSPVAPARGAAGSSLADNPINHRYELSIMPSRGYSGGGLLAAANSPAEPVSALACVPDCRGVDLSEAHLTDMNLNGVNLCARRSTWSTPTSMTPSSSA